MSRICSPEETLLLQRMIATHASRIIFADGRPERATIFRPRQVDAAQFREEETAWAGWHAEQSAVDR